MAGPTHERAAHELHPLSERIDDLSGLEGSHVCAVASVAVAWLAEPHRLRSLRDLWTSADPAGTLVEQLGQPLEQIEATWITQTTEPRPSDATGRAPRRSPPAAPR